MKHVCPKCHRKKKRSVFSRHVKSCVPSPEQVRHYAVSREGTGKLWAKSKA